MWSPGLQRHANLIARVHSVAFKQAASQLTLEPDGDGTLATFTDMLAATEEAAAKR
jgi:hypothetical protein